MLYLPLDQPIHQDLFPDPGQSFISVPVAPPSRLTRPTRYIRQVRVRRLQGEERVEWESGRLRATQLALPSSCNFHPSPHTMEPDGYNSVTHPVPLAAPNPNHPFQSEGLVRNLSNLCAKTLSESSVRYSGAAVMDQDPVPPRRPPLAKATRDSMAGQIKVLANKSTSISNGVHNDSAK